ncbi:hypothetical protein Trydic_g23338 [Trypoxylus dichotomus]
MVGRRRRCSELSTTTAFKDSTMYLAAYLEVSETTLNSQEGVLPQGSTHNEKRSLYFAQVTITVGNAHACHVEGSRVRHVFPAIDSLSGQYNELIGGKASRSMHRPDTVEEETVSSIPGGCKIGSRSRRSYSDERIKFRKQANASVRLLSYKREEEKRTGAR